MRTIKVFVINFVFRAIVTVAVLTLETEINVFGNTGTTQTGLYGPLYDVWWCVPVDIKSYAVCVVLCFIAWF